jgi:hypothetical protein
LRPLGGLACMLQSTGKLSGGAEKILTKKRLLSSHCCAQ